MQEDPIQFFDNYLFTPTAWEKAGPVWPIRLGRNIAKPNYHVGPRFTPYYSLHFVLEGEGSFLQNGSTYALSAGDIFCLFPRLTQEYYTSGHSPLKLAWVAFDGRMGLELCERIGVYPNYPYRSGACDPSVAAILDDFFDAVRDGERAQAADLGKLAHFYRLFDCLARTAPRPRSDDGAAHWLQRGKEYMEVHYAEGITIEEVSGYIGVDRTHFSKRFRQAYGISPIQYLQKLKMDAARLLLKETDSKLLEIAQSVGYPDVFSFSKTFKKFFGLSPSQYRYRK
ncbi:AraC family transcriptional regulator [Cohnella zeiphila]|uniref:AraC family transcriptional regulator n=1 Tax=Cohnella zeiphila TaxID=2761120 RepID=A0A7X0SLR1_9BACL|nr:AraC family transcriptional regulator [Cohnella zeiphila]MBB6732332.1 AraC family transcriptional regulator [Cohnella zeiphila]